MPINYGPNQEWPPPADARIRLCQAEWLAWYGGDPDELARFYSTQRGPRVRPSQVSGGIFGAIGRVFWGRPVLASGAIKLHIPAASDVSRLSANMLFADPPALTLPTDDRAINQATRDRLAWLEPRPVGRRMAQLLRASATPPS